MYLLAEFNVIKPEYGLIFWTTLIFLFLWMFLGKKAFGPIAKALKEREDSITESLAAAETAKKEMSNLKSENEKLLVQAREERTKLLQDAKEAANQMIAEAKNKAKEEAGKILASANVEIENQKKAAIADVKNQVGQLAIDIAGSLMKKDLGNNQEQINLAKSLASEIKLN